MSQGTLARAVEIAASHGMKSFGVFPIKGGASLLLSTGNIVKYGGCAIVNAANERGLGGGGVDGAITHAGGIKMDIERQALPIVRKNCRIPTGEARTTTGGDCPAKFCIHAVGPCYYDLKSLEEGDVLLSGAYAFAMQEAKANGVKHLAFPLISAGVYRGHQSRENVVKIGMKTIAENGYEGLETVHMIGFSKQEIQVLEAVAKELFE